MLYAQSTSTVTSGRSTRAVVGNDEGGQKSRTDRSRSKRNLTSAEYESSKEYEMSIRLGESLPRKGAEPNSEDKRDR